MKKFLALLLVFTLLFSFAACNKDDVNSGEESTSKQDVEQTVSGEEDTTKKKPRPETTTAAPFVNPNLTEPAELFKVVGADNYTLVSRDPNTSASSGKTMISKRYELKNSTGNTFSANVNTGNTDFVLNETLLKDFIASGWTIASKYDANTALESGKEMSVILKNAQGKVTKLIVTNKNSASMAISECPITEIGIMKSITQQEWADFSVNGVQVTSTATYSDFVRAFGNPKTVNVAEYYQGNDYEYCKTVLLFEKTVNNETWSMSVTCIDEKGNVTIDSCIFEVK